MSCIFCNSENVTRFAEHFTFCKDCSAIYTFPNIVRGCEHTVGKHLPVVLRLPWYEIDFPDMVLELNGQYYCTKCWCRVWLNGW
jgi:hypothetical protein